MNNEFPNQQVYDDKVAEIARLAVSFIKTGSGIDRMRSAFNELCERSGANKGIDHDSTLGRRTLIAQSVSIRTIPALTHEELHRLDDKLREIANDYTEPRAVRRGWHR